MCCGISQMDPSCSAHDKLNLSPAVKEMKNPRLHQGLFDFQCRHELHASSSKFASAQRAAVNLCPLTSASPL